MSERFKPTEAFASLWALLPHSCRLMLKGLCARQSGTLQPVPATQTFRSIRRHQCGEHAHNALRVPRCPVLGSWRPCGAACGRGAARE